RELPGLVPEHHLRARRPPVLVGRDDGADLDAVVVDAVALRPRVLDVPRNPGRDPLVEAELVASAEVAVGDGVESDRPAVLKDAARTDGFQVLDAQFGVRLAPDQDLLLFVPERRHHQPSESREESLAAPVFFQILYPTIVDGGCRARMSESGREMSTDRRACV